MWALVFILYFGHCFHVQIDMYCPYWTFELFVYTKTVLVGVYALDISFEMNFLEFRGSNMVIMICAFHIHMCTISLVSSSNNFILFFSQYVTKSMPTYIRNSLFVNSIYFFLALKMKLNWEFKSWFVQFISPENHKQEQHHTSIVLWWIAKLVCLFRAVEFFFSQI